MLISEENRGGLLDVRDDFVKSPKVTYFFASPLLIGRTLATPTIIFFNILIETRPTHTQQQQQTQTPQPHKHLCASLYISKEIKPIAMSFPAPLIDREDADNLDPEASTQNW